MLELLDGVEVAGRAPGLDGDAVVVDGRVAGRVAGRRVDWARDMDGRLSMAVETERRLFDARALALLRTLGPQRWVEDPAAWLDLRLQPSPRLAPLVARLPRLGGARVLELGGSGQTTPGFLAAGAARVDQLDVSAGMLDVAMARLDETQRARVVQHRTFAEALPFARGTFDVVFSRHCLHHMDRRRVLPEVARVLRPTGAMLVIEPYLSRPLRAAVALRRRVKGAERGADDPLGAADLALARSCFGEVTVVGEPAPSVLVRGAPRLARLTREKVDPRLPGGLVRAVGGRVLVLARRPAAPS